MIQRQTIKVAKDPVQTKQKEEEKVQAKLMVDHKLQRKIEKEEAQIQTRPISRQITPSVQRELEPEKVESTETKLIQRLAPEEDEEESIHTKAIQQQINSEEDKDAKTGLQHQAEKEEELQQIKAINGRTAAVTPCIESSIRFLKGGGQPLSKASRDFFEPRFGANFSRVRIHDNEDSAHIARALNAQAFTIGSHITFNAGQYAPRTDHGWRLLAHELTHTIQQTNGRKASCKNIIQCAQIGRVHAPAAGGASHFIYELDATMSLFSQLASHYGVSIRAIQRANPGTSATRLRHGMRISVPANNPPTTVPPSILILPGPLPLPYPLIAVGMVHSTTTAPVDVRWNLGAGSNRVGRLPRGTVIALHPFGNGSAWINISSLQNPATGILNELRLRGIAGSNLVFAYLPPTNVRFTGTPTPASDVNLLARMIWGEQRNQGNNAMAAAAWISKNRFNAGWGLYSQIITRAQFHGLATPAQVIGLTGSNLVAWNEAQRIAQEVVNGIIADPTNGALFFGNGAAVLRRMRACARRNPAFRYGTIPGTNFHYSNGDYTSVACTVP